MENAGETSSTSYREALIRLRREGYRIVEKSLYAETVDAQLARLREGPAAASAQEVRLVRHGDRVEIFRVQRVGEREYLDESPQAVVRRGDPA